MELYLGWILLGLPLAFALGWFASRMDLRQLRLESKAAPKAYFRGLKHLLNEQQDEAIDAFIEAAQNDPDTSDLHFALGDLFRRRGDYERAVRVHEHLLARADLGHADRDAAQYALAQDFLKAGLLDHAESAFLKLQDTPFRQEAAMGLLTLYERAHDWDQALQTAEHLQQDNGMDLHGRIAHYLCEMAAAEKLAPENGHPLLERAIRVAPDAGRPRIELARRLAAEGKPAAAVEQFMQLAAHRPQLMPLVAGELLQQAALCDRSEMALAQIRTLDEKHPSIDLTDALVQAREAGGMPPAKAMDSYLRHMAREPSPLAAERWIFGQELGDADTRHLLEQSLRRATQPRSRYRCAACGFEASTYFWQCPGCQAWDSFPPRRVDEL